MSALDGILVNLRQFWPVAIALAMMLAPVRRKYWPPAILAVALLANFIGLRLGWINIYVVRIEALICITAILVVSLNLINGCTGMFSIGHAGFMIVGGYTAALVTGFLFRLHPGVPLALSGPAFLIALVMGGLAAALFGLVVGMPTLRLRGDYLAIATLGFSEIICVILRFVTFHKDVGGVSFEVGGPRGIMDIPAMPGPMIHGLGRASPAFVTLCYCMIVMALVVWAIRNFAASSHGRACGAIRDDEVAAEILGVDTVFYKVAVFALGAFMAGVGGGLLAHWLSLVHPSMGGFLVSIDYLILVYVGGAGSISGSLLAVVALTITDETLKDVLRGWDAWRMAFHGALLIAIMLWRPRGLFGGREFKWLISEPGRPDGRP